MAADATAEVPSGETAGEAAVFAILGNCYLEPPTRDQLSTIREWAVRWREMAPSSELEAALEPLTSVEPGDADRLNEAFTQLFRGVVPDAPDPPYESLYRDGQLQGPSAQAVRAAYREAGVTRASSTGELIDHLGIELHFAATLAERGDEETLEEFVTTHTAVWFDEFRAAIEARDPPAFYRGLLAVTGLALAATTDPETSLVDDPASPSNRPAGTHDQREPSRDRSLTDSRSELDL